jgi:hypothetical protein
MPPVLPRLRPTVTSCGPRRWREKHLTKIIGEEGQRASSEEIMKEHRLAFVVHSEEVAQTLETFAREKDRLIKVIPSTRGSYAKEMGIKGSWLVFETSE